MLTAYCDDVRKNDGFDIDPKAAGARNIAGRAAEPELNIRRPRGIRFIGGADTAAVNLLLAQHLESSGNKTVTILCDRDFASMAKLNVDQRRVLIVEVPHSADQVSLGTAVKSLLRANPDEFVVQTGANLPERLEDGPAFISQLETAWRCGHSVTCCIVAEQHAFISAIALILLRWNEGMWEEELGNLVVQWGSEDLTSETALQLKSAITFRG